MSIKHKKYTDFPETVLLREFEGDIEVEDIINSWEYLLQENLITEKITGVVNNLTSCNLNMDLKSFEKLLAYLKSHPEIKRLKLAVICDNPQKIVFPIIGEKRIPEFKIKPFSTIKAAINWIIFEP